MKRTRPATTEFPCVLCDSDPLHEGPHRTLVNAASTAMFWGAEPAIAALMLEAERGGEGPGMVCVPNHEGNAVVFLWIDHAHEAQLAERYWPGVGELALEMQRERGWTLNVDERGYRGDRIRQARVGRRARLGVDTD